MDPFLKFEAKKIEKGTVIQQAGAVSRYGFKVISGCLKAYVIDDVGRERVFQFVPEDWLYSDFDSHLNKTPSAICLEAIEPSEVIFVPANHIEDLSRLTQEELILMNNKFRRNIISLNRRLIGLLTSDAEARYTEFMETYPSLVQRLPLKLIASYLGMTPEYLSDVRKKMAQK